MISGVADGDAIRLGEEALTYAQLRRAAAAVAEAVAGRARVAVWAEPGAADPEAVRRRRATPLRRG